jgi:hypothetical protein
MLPAVFRPALVRESIRDNGMGVRYKTNLPIAHTVHCLGSMAHIGGVESPESRGQSGTVDIVGVAFPGMRHETITSQSDLEV